MVCDGGMHHICSISSTFALFLCGIWTVGEEGWACQYEIIPYDIYKRLFILQTV
jgi:hypothetical protein